MGREGDRERGVVGTNFVANYATFLFFNNALFGALGGVTWCAMICTKWVD